MPEPVTGPMGPAPVERQVGEGVRAQARLELGRAVRALANVIALLRDALGSDEARAAVRALNTLAPVAPEIDEGVGRSELEAMLRRIGALPMPPTPGPLGFLPPAPRAMGPQVGPSVAPGTGASLVIPGPVGGAP